MRSLAATVNSPLLTELAHRIGYHDVECVEFFRRGRPFSGAFVCLAAFASAAGAPLLNEGAEWHLGLCQASNAELFAQLRHDVNEEQLHQITCDDAAMHRMSAPVKAAAGRTGCSAAPGSVWFRVCDLMARRSSVPWTTSRGHALVAERSARGARSNATA